MARLLPFALAAALAALPGCYRISHAIADDENPDTVYFTPLEQGGETSHFEETVVVYSSLRGLIMWNNADPRAVLAKYYNTGKIQNLVITHQQTFAEGALSTTLGVASLLFDMRQVKYEGEVVRRIGGY
jgi:hypothetical protein